MNYEQLYINGQWVPSHSDHWIDVENPYTMKNFARVPSGNAEDVNDAVAAAHAAFPAWSKTTLDYRIELMETFLSIFKSMAVDIVNLETQELGAPISFGRTAHCDYQFTRIRSYIDLAPQVPMVETMPLSTTYRAPVGVIACITPWNYPIGQVVQKVIPALLMGNTVVLKPSQQTPLTVYLMAQAFHDAGFPAGTFNMITGRGGQVGNALTEHPLVNMISFTGSTSAGIQVAQSGLNTVKHISLELGGKSPCVVLKGADYEKAVRGCFNTIFLNSGQTCTALSRLLIPAEDKAEFEIIMKRLVSEYKVGNPMDPSINVGPMVSKAQFDTVRDYIKLGVDSGAHMLVGEYPVAEPGDNGYAIQPTIFTNVTNDMTIAREEIFGPVLTVITYEFLEEALQIANDTPFGLNAAVWGPKEQAIEVALQIESGNIYINDSPRDTAAPFGGWKESGIGREGSVYGMLEFTQQRALFDTCE